MTLIPEQPFDVEEVCRLVKAIASSAGMSHFICVVAEGREARRGLDGPMRHGGIDEFGHEKFTGVAQQLALRSREAHPQGGPGHRSGPHSAWRHPTAYDRVLATRFGVNAADARTCGRVRA